MRTYTPEISWHNREPVFGVDIQRKIIDSPENKKSYRIATCGGDNSLNIWQVIISDQQPKIDKFFNKKQQIDDDEINLDVQNVVDDLVNKSVLDSETIDNTKSSISKPTSNQNDKNKNQNNDKPIILCSINTIHQKTINVCKFAPKSDLIATGSDDQNICVFKFMGLNEQTESDAFNPFNDDSEIVNTEIWKIQISFRRKHLEDIVDLNWSPDEKYIVSGSIDNCSYIYKVETGEPLYELAGHSGYVQGVAWDPLSNYIVTLCTDRVLRIFNANIDKKVRKFSIAKIKNTEFKKKDDTTFKTNLFYDDTLATISRRISFSPNGELLICSSGIVEYDESDEFVNCVHLFYRENDNFKKLHCYIPTGAYTNSVSFCQKMFKLNPNLNNPYSFPYRYVFAIAAQNRILIYDTQQPYPIARICDIHYTRICDLSWSIDGRVLLATSTDGFCTFIYFDEDELGERYVGEPYKFENLKEVETNTQSKKQTASTKKSANKSSNDKKDENVSNENLTNEKNANINKITNYYTQPSKKPHQPLLPTKLDNSFKQLSNNQNKIDNKIDNDIMIVKMNDNFVNNNVNKLPINKLTTNIQSLVKKKPKDNHQNNSIISYVNNINQIKTLDNQTTTNQYSQVKSIDNNENSKLLNNNNDNLRIKRSIEQNSSEEEPKTKSIKKRVELIKVD